MKRLLLILILLLVCVQKLPEKDVAVIHSYFLECIEPSLAKETTREGRLIMWHSLQWYCGNEALYRYEQGNENDN